MALKDKKLSPDVKPDPALAAEIERWKEPDGTVSCATAIRLAESMKVKAEDVGRTLDALSVHLGKCQIGTFGYPGHAKGWGAGGPDLDSEPDDLRPALLEAGGPEKRISCLSLWNIAAGFRISRMSVGYAADRAGLKIIDCQLGAF